MLHLSDKTTEDADFASPYDRNHSSTDVLNYQPVEKVMFVYKMLAEAGTNQYFQPSARDYAETAQKLFEKLGISSSIVTGSLKAHQEQSHFWNIVTIDGYAFHFDAYFANPEHLKELGNTNAYESFMIDNLIYDFFCVSTQRITQTHTIDEDNSLVDCQHSLSHELVRSLASMKVHTHFGSPGELMGSIFPSSPIINYIASSTPITLSFE